MESTVKATGGGRVGWANATWPLATLKVDSRVLTLRVWPFGTYTFNRDEIISLENHGCFVSPGIKITHNVSEYPLNIIFWHFGNSEKLIQKILRTGFIPAADPSSMPKRSSAVKWEAVIGSIIIYGIMIVFDRETSARGAGIGPLSYIALLFMLFCSIFIRKSYALQKIFLKDGHKVEEISDYLNALAFFSATIMILGFFGVLK